MFRLSTTVFSSFQCITESANTDSPSSALSLSVLIASRTRIISSSSSALSTQLATFTDLLLNLMFISFFHLIRFSLIRAWFLAFCQFLASIQVFCSWNKNPLVYAFCMSHQNGLFPLSVCDPYQSLQSIKNRSPRVLPCTFLNLVCFWI